MDAFAQNARHRLPLSRSSKSRAPCGCRSSIRFKYPTILLQETLPQRQFQNLHRRGIARVHFNGIGLALPEHEIHTKKPTEAAGRGHDVAQVGYLGSKFLVQLERSDAATVTKGLRAFQIVGSDQFAGRPKEFRAPAIAKVNRGTRQSGDELLQVIPAAAKSGGLFLFPKADAGSAGAFPRFDEPVAARRRAL